jgi:hypothetical protein
MTSETPDSKSNRLNYISIELPFENWFKCDKFSINQSKSSNINSSRPYSAQAFAIIHSSPQYQSSIKSQRSTNYQNKFSTSVFKDPENQKPDTSKKIHLHLNLKRFDLKSEGSLRINSLKFEKPLKQNLNTPEVIPLKSRLTFEGFKKEMNKKIPNTLKAFLKNKSEVKLKNKVIEIPQTDSPKIKRVTKGKILKRPHRDFMNEKKKVDTNNLLIWGSKKVDSSMNTNRLERSN